MIVALEKALQYLELLWLILGIRFLAILGSFCASQGAFVELHCISNVELGAKELLEEIENILLLIESCKVDWVPIDGVDNDSSLFLGLKCSYLTEIFTLDSSHFYDVLGPNTHRIYQRSQFFDIATDCMINELFKNLRCIFPWILDYSDLVWIVNLTVLLLMTSHNDLASLGLLQKLFKIRYRVH